jgi:UDP-N-acetylmuramoylalanine--D-glutamate ligase
MSDFIYDLKLRGIVILGAGVSGVAIVKAARKFNIPFSIVDEKMSSCEIDDRIENIINNFESIAGNPIVIVSPGWKKDNELVIEALSRNWQLMGEIDFAWCLKEQLAPMQKWIGVTGTNGKTTTIQMVESIINSSQIHGVACGNVGVAAVDAVTHEPPYDLLALELSSFQIEWMRLAKLEAAAILNVAPDHIDWHGSFEAYREAKFSLADRARILIINSDDPTIDENYFALTHRKNFVEKVVPFTLGIPGPGEIGLVEEVLVDRAFVKSAENAEAFGELQDVKPLAPHNVSNALAAASLCLAVGDDAPEDFPFTHESVNKGIKEFTVDRHRLELIAQINGISWIDDSKATNPHAAAAALRSFHNVIWIAGGLAKGAQMDELMESVGSRIKAAIVIGADREIIANALTARFPETPCLRVGNGETGLDLMRLVVKAARSIAQEEDVVLLSPACASMDQFKSYADRGDSFARAVKEALFENEAEVESGA